jgi:hypothetical protein
MKSFGGSHTVEGHAERKKSGRAVRMEDVVTVVIVVLGVEVVVVVAL